MNYIAATTREFDVVTNPVIEGLGLPKGMARKMENFISFPPDKAFPGVHNSTNRLIGDWPEHHVDMVRHHNPRSQCVSLTIKEFKRSRNKSSDVRAP